MNYNFSRFKNEEGEFGPPIISREQYRRQNPNAPFTAQELRERQERELSFAGTEEGGPLGSAYGGFGRSYTSSGLIGYGDAAQERAKTAAREEEELASLRRASEARSLQSQMAFQPYMESLRGGIMSKMGQSLGVRPPTSMGTYSSGTGYTPSWMQSYQPPQFPSMMNTPYYR